MSPDQRELYEQIILHHNTAPQNYHRLDPASHHAEGYNPICGDHYHIYLNVEDGTITDVGFQGHGCAISKASASIMTTLLRGRTSADAEALFDTFHRLITSRVSEVPDFEELGEMAALAGVRNYPNRIKCVNLAWHAMRSALHCEPRVSTE